MSRADKELFRDFGDGSFRAVMWWVNEEAQGLVYYQCLAVMDWEDVSRVEAHPMPNPYPDNLTPDGPKCTLVWRDGEIKIRASFTEVAKARAEWRRRNRFQTIGAN